MKSKHGVLTINRFMWIDGDQLAWNTCVPGSLQEVTEIALQHRITHVWVMPAVGEFEVPASGGDWSIKPFYRHGRVATVSIWKRGTGHVDVIYPHNTAWSLVLADAKPGEVVGMPTYLQQALGIEITGSPGSSGWELLKSIHPEWIEDVPVNLRDLHFTAKAGNDLIWEHPELAQLAAMFTGGYIHKFDRRSAYPYTATQTAYGKGTPVHLVGEAAQRASEHVKGHPQDIGVWRATIRYDGGKGDADMPPVWKEDQGSYASGTTGEQWLAGPIIRLLRSFGHEVIIHEGYVFPEKHNLLTQWANLLMTVRADFMADVNTWRSKAAAKRAADGAKLIANTTIGFLAFKGFADEEEEKRRPDIRLQTVARQRELLRHNIQWIADNTGYKPCMVYMDAVYYFSELPVLTFDYFNKRAGQPGEMKYEGSIQITPELAAMFSEHMSTARRLEVLNKKGWSK